MIFISPADDTWREFLVVPMNHPDCARRHAETTALILTATLSETCTPNSQMRKRGFTPEFR